ncbi:RHS repeat-associated core domain-containing protein [Roseivirga sp. BDSF3-8]|uniref:RHS repeat-associated core domain-containing protein n=1 Tax=Roseivirga sp. BDSF3-8 TaxID=3241598 RepID=UPI0035324F2A
MLAATGRRKRARRPRFYSTQYREYDPALGRFHAIDPMASKFATWTPYMYGYNDPVNFNDPNGAQVAWRSLNNPVPIEMQFFSQDPVGGSQMAWRTTRVGLGSSNHWSNKLHLEAKNYNVLAQRMSVRQFLQFSGVSDVYGRKNEEKRKEIAESVGFTIRSKWNPIGGGAISYEEWLAKGGDPNDLDPNKIYTFFPGSWEFVGVDIQKRSNNKIASPAAIFWMVAAAEEILAALGVISGATYHANDRRSRKPNYLYEIYRYKGVTSLEEIEDWNNHEWENYEIVKYGISSDQGQRVENQVAYFNREAKALGQPYVYGYNILHNNIPGRYEALLLEKWYVTFYNYRHHRLPVFQRRPVPWY